MIRIISTLAVSSFAILAASCCCTSEAQPPSYTICVVGAARGSLYTFASRVPAAVWEERASELREAASSFVLLG